MRVFPLLLSLFAVVCSSSESVDFPDFESVEILPEEVEETQQPQLVPVWHPDPQEFRDRPRRRWFVLTAAFTALIIVGGVFAGFFFLLKKTLG